MRKTSVALFRQLLSWSGRAKVRNVEGVREIVAPASRLQHGHPGEGDSFLGGRLGGFRSFHQSRTAGQLPQGSIQVLALISGLSLFTGGIAWADAPPQSGAGLASEPGDESTGENKKKVVILGSGWGAVSCLKGIDTRVYDVTVVSPRNYFLFTPLLPGVTSGSMEGRSISEPVRRIIKRNKKNASFLEANCIDIDPIAKRVTCTNATDVAISTEEFEVEYDYLVVAVGACTNTFNTPGVTEYCHFLKEVEDAERIRENIVNNFEAAALPTTSLEEKKRLLHFVVVGGGPTGVEFAAELHDLVNEDLTRLYPGVAEISKISLIQSGDHILNTFDQRISDFAEKKFQRDGVEVRTGARVIDITATDIGFREKRSGGVQRLSHGLVVWSTGIGTRPVVSKFMNKIGQSDRRAIATDEWLRVKGCSDVFALGDCATIEHRPMKDDISVLFQMADSNGDGTLTGTEFMHVLSKVKERYPLIHLYLRSSALHQLLKDVCPDQVGTKANKVHVSISEFEKALAKVDSQMKSLPATAQVAAQQGAYLANCLNKQQDPNFVPEGPPRVRRSGQHRYKPFEYKHFGQFAPVGSGEAAVQLPGDWVNVGRSTQWLWYSVYASKQVSWRTRFLVVFDWTKKAIFGRDSSRM